MPAKTQDIKVLLGISEHLYEAAMVIAKRARQVNDELYQKKRDRQILEELEGGFEDDFLNTETEERDTKANLDDEENPVIYAQAEFLRKKLEYHYESRRGR